jgi:hypothetical protein
MSLIMWGTYRGGELIRYDTQIYDSDTNVMWGKQFGCEPNVVE